MELDENLIDVLTNIICMCSVEHSATNFPQYGQFVFPPNFAAMFHGQPNEAAVTLLIRFHTHTTQKVFNHIKQAQKKKTNLIF